MPLTLIAAALAAQSVTAEPPRPRSLNPAAVELFERDSELKAWALRIYDANGDGWLTLFEAQPAIRRFKDIADANRDGRVTVREYQAAKQFIRARWAAQQ